MKKIEIFFDANVFNVGAITPIAKFAVRKGFLVHVVASYINSYQCGVSNNPKFWTKGDAPAPKKNWWDRFKKEIPGALFWCDGFFVSIGYGCAAKGTHSLLLGTSDRYGYQNQYDLLLKEVETIREAYQAIKEWSEA